MGDLIDALVRRREQIGVSQKAVGKTLGLSRSTVGHWERRIRTPHYEHLTAWAAALGCQLTVRVDPDVAAPVIAVHQATQDSHYEWMRHHPRDGRFLLPARR